MLVMYILYFVARAACLSVPRASGGRSSTCLTDSHIDGAVVGWLHTHVYGCTRMQPLHVVSLGGRAALPAGLQTGSVHSATPLHTHLW